MAVHKVSDYAKMHMKVNTAIYMWKNGEEPPGWEKSDLLFQAIRMKLDELAPELSEVLPDAAIWFFSLCCANMTHYALLLIRIAADLSRDEFKRCRVAHEQVSPNVIAPMMKEGLYPMLGRWPESQWINKVVYQLYQEEKDYIEKRIYWERLLEG